MFTDGQIFSEAWDDNYAVKSDGYTHKSVFLYGVKISKSKSDGTIVIENIGNHSGRYSSPTNEQMDIFRSRGWRKGVYSVSISNFENIISDINNMILKTDDESKIKKHQQLKEVYELKLTKMKEKNEKFI